MEPVLGGRDDCHGSPDPCQPGPGRNVARPWRTGRPATTWMIRSARGAPQWSPSLADGTTRWAGVWLWAGWCCRNGARPWRTGRRGCRHAVRDAAHAAMEPVLGGRDDRLHRRVLRRLPPRRNGARPWRTGRPVRVPAVAVDGVRAAMEPVLGGRDDSPTALPGRTSASSRNGARPWRTGRHCDLGYGQELRVKPQWSPSLADGTTSIISRGICVSRYAVMEPVLGGRDDPELMIVGSGQTVRRNGARPWRTGRRAHGPRRPHRRRQPQWSPSLADGTTRSADAAGRRPGLAAMEPVLGGRDDLAWKRPHPTG